MGGRGFLDQMRRGLDRASFEADRLMRYNRVRAEALRLRQQGREKIQLIGEKALEMHRAGLLTVPELSELAQAVGDLDHQAVAKEQEAEAIQKEDWQPSEETVAAGGDPQPGASSGPAPPPIIEAAAGDVDYSAHPNTAVKYCPACGAQLRAQATFCSRCGAQQH